MFRDSLAHRDVRSNRNRGSSPVGWEAYKTCLKNKNILLVSLVFMAGAAGRGQDINEVYIIPHFVHDFNFDITYGAFLFHVHSGRQLDRTICLGLDLGSFQSQTGDPSVTVDVGACARSGSLGKKPFLPDCSSIWWFTAPPSLRADTTQALLADLVGEDLFDAAFSLYYLSVSSRFRFGL